MIDWEKGLFGTADQSAAPAASSLASDGLAWMATSLEISFLSSGSTDVGAGKFHFTAALSLFNEVGDPNPLS